MLALSNQSYNKVLKQADLSNNSEAIRQIRNAGNNITYAVEQYLKQIDRTALVIKGYQWEYNLIDDEALNAWCMPGGKIAFYTGILPLCKNENGIAVVMAHEISHAIAKHGNARMSQQLAINLGGMALSEALQKESKFRRNSRRCFSNCQNSILYIHCITSSVGNSRWHQGIQMKMGECTRKSIFWKVKAVSGLYRKLP